MNIIECRKCGKEFTQYFHQSSYWIKKEWCSTCRADYDEEAKQIDEDWLTTRREIMDRLSTAKKESKC